MGDTNTNGWKKVENPVKSSTAVADKPQADAAAQELPVQAAADKAKEEHTASSAKKEKAATNTSGTGTKKTAGRKPRAKTEDAAVLPDTAPDVRVPAGTEKSPSSEDLKISPAEPAKPDDTPQPEITPPAATISTKAGTGRKRASAKKPALPDTDESAQNITEELAAIPQAKSENMLVRKEDSAAGWKQVGMIPSQQNMEGEDAPVIRAPYDYAKKPQRKRRYRFAAPLGLLVILLAATGVISLVVMGVQAIQRSQDDTALRSELMDFLEPVVQYMPSPFDDVNDNPQEALLLGAIWRVTDEERIRMLREKDDVSRYPTDDLGRMEIPVSKILDSYAALFGKDAQPSLVTIGDPGLSFTFEYDSANGIYHVPYTSASTSYVPVLDTVKHKGSSYTLRIGYVPNNDIGVDEKGNPVDPLPEQADYFLIYHVEKEGDGWRLVSVSADK